MINVLGDLSAMTVLQPLNLLQKDSWISDRFIIATERTLICTTKVKWVRMCSSSHFINYPPGICFSRLRTAQKIPVCTLKDSKRVLVENSDISQKLNFPAR